MVSLLKVEILRDGRLRGLADSSSPVQSFYGEVEIDASGEIWFEHKPVTRLKPQARATLLDYLDNRERRLHLEKKQLALGHFPGSDRMGASRKAEYIKERHRNLQLILMGLRKARRKILTMPPLQS